MSHLIARSWAVFIRMGLAAAAVVPAVALLPCTRAVATAPSQMVDLRPKFTVGRETRLKLQTDETN